MTNKLLHLTQRSTFLFVHSLTLIVAQKSTTTAAQMSKALCVKGRMKLTTIIFLILMSMRSLAEQIEVIPDECGPLARGKLGVIFSLAPHGSRKLYFSEGNASELCPRMVKAKSITGYEIDYCEEYEPANINECGKIKFFKIVKFNYE